MASTTRTTRMGVVAEATWTVIAAERDGQPVPAEVGRRKVTRRVHWAYRAEGEAWLAAQLAAGWVLEGDLCPCATFYHGPTDSPSNCWAAEVSRELPAASGAEGQAPQVGATASDQPGASLEEPRPLTQADLTCAAMVDAERMMAR